MSIRTLANHMQRVPAGPIPSEKRDIVIGLLAECWHDFHGSSDTRMKAWKLARDSGPSDLTWDPPVLSITIERHGGLVLGSKRAEKQRWAVDLEKRTAHAESVGHRQVHPQSPAFTSKMSGAIADTVCAAVNEGPNSASPLVTQRTVFWENENEVRVRHGNLVNAGNKQTMIDRRKRLRRDLQCKMEMIGWRLSKVGRTMDFKR